MENKYGSGASAGSQGGKGFYIVLFLCAAVIGVSAWMLLTDQGTNVEAETADMAEVDMTEEVMTILPAGQTTEKEAAEAMADTMEADGEQAEDAAQIDTDAPETQAVFSESVTSYIWPVQGSIQTPYSIQTLLYDSTMADWRTHDGIDITSDIGTPVMAAAAGTVTSVSSDDLLGTMVQIDHGNGTHSVYANLAGSPTVAPGDVVTMGQVIGSVGGTALGETNQVSHLHFAMREDGLSADPTLYLPSEEMQ